MALAQEHTSFHPEPESTVKLSSSKTQHPRADHGTDGRLAMAVAELSALEDSIVARVTEAARLFAQLEQRGVREGAGYDARAQFENRVMRTAPLLRSLRSLVDVPAVKVRAVKLVTKGGKDAIGRRTRALTELSRAIERMRELESEVHETGIATVTCIRSIENERLFEECGYDSFEEFLERALGPSPVIASVVTLLGDEADRESPAVESEERCVSDGLQRDSDQLVADSLFASSMHLPAALSMAPSGVGAVANEVRRPTEKPAAPAVVAASSAKAAASGSKQVVTTVVLSIAMAGVGALAGGFGRGVATVSPSTQHAVTTAAVEASAPPHLPPAPQVHEGDKALPSTSLPKGPPVSDEHAVEPSSSSSSHRAAHAVHGVEGAPPRVLAVPRALFPTGEHVEKLLGPMVSPT